MTTFQSIEVYAIQLNYVERDPGQPLLFIDGAPMDYRAWNTPLKFSSNVANVISRSAPV